MLTKPSSIFIYHANCSDGFAAAWTYRKIDPTAEFVPATHGDQPPVVDGCDVVIADFSYDRDTLIDLNNRASSLIVLDHHISAQQNLEGLDFCVFDMSRSGAGIVWDHYHSRDQLPERHWIIDYVEDRDLWKHDLPDSHEISAAMNSYPMTFEVWDQIANMDKEQLIAEGKAIVRYQDQLIADLIDRNLTHREIAGISVPCINSSVLQSKIGNKLMEDNPPFAAVYYEKNGQRIFSLRSTDDCMNVSKIASKLGGGGHRNSAGFAEDIDE